MATPQSDLVKILKSYDIRKTGSRLDILRQFTEHQHALSQPYLEKALDDQYDRVTIYRTLTLYQEKGLIHTVLDDSGAMKYALCRDTCSHAHHNHDHVHFKCNDCGQTTCLDEVLIPRLSLPSGYIPQEQNLLITGVCDQCNN